MSDQTITTTTNLTRHAAKLLTACTIGFSSIAVSLLTVTGTVIMLIIATPALILCSPVIVTAVIAVFLMVGGLLFSNGSGFAAVMGMMWVYNYVMGKHPPGEDKIEYAKKKMKEKARYMKERAEEYSLYLQQKALNGY